jgi:hypothetical protein
MITRTLRIALILTTGALLSPVAFGGFSLKAHDAKKTLKEKRPCQLAIGMGHPASPQDLEPRIVCVAEVVKSQNTIDEDLGCSVVLYDLQAGIYRAGDSNLRIATRLACDDKGLATLDPHLFADHAARDLVRARILHSESEALTRWWRVHYEKALARAAAARRTLPGKSVPAGKIKRPWKYDGKAQFEGI